MIRSNHLCVLAVSALVICLGTASASWADRDEDSERRGRRGPPQEAIDACAEAAEASVCSFVSPRGDELSGECLEKHDALVCVPEGHEKRRRGRGRHDGERGGGQGGEQSDELEGDDSEISS